MYSPKIKEELVMAMYQLKLKTGKPITKQANEAVQAYVRRLRKKIREETKDVILNTRPIMSDVSNQKGQALQNDVSKAYTVPEGRERTEVRS